MQDKLLSEFPEVSYESWRAQVEKDLKGADFEKRLLTRTPEGIAVQPLYTARAGAPSSSEEAIGFAGLAPYRRGPKPVGSYGARWDVCTEQIAANPHDAARDIAEDLSGGASSLWLRFDAHTRTGDSARSVADGLQCDSLAQLDAVLAPVDLEATRLSLDAGGNVALPALHLALADLKQADPTRLSGSLGCDPLGALARDGSLPYDLARARVLFTELCAFTAHSYPQLRAAVVDLEPYQLAGASAVQEVGYALATGLTYLRWNLEAGLALEKASAELSFRVPVASDMFLELAKLRALRLCWAKLIAAHGGGPDAQNTHIHAVTALGTKTRRDPWVNMLRTTTEAFAAMVGGADSVTTRGFDAALGRSDSFARRIARNAQVILNEEAHITHVADAAGGSYYVETLTDQLARSAWTALQEIERQGGMAQALATGAVAQAIETTARARLQAVAKRSAPLTGVSEFANLSEEPVHREAFGQRTLVDAPLPSETAQQAVEKLRAAEPGARFAAAMQAALQGASVDEITRALAVGTVPVQQAALPVRRPAEGFEALRDRVERHVASGKPAPKAFLCNLGDIPKHKARASFATGFLNAGGLSALDNDGFANAQAAAQAFAAADTSLVVICGSDDQYPEWIPTLVPELRARGAKQIVVAGRPGDRQASDEQAGVTGFIFMGTDVVASLHNLLDAMGVVS
ncbi:MAG TPA: methylmalonyl-CoA mutase family protein [Polyangiales bacterium]|nr:methylmalonyl-CoA mutase family protein [Polyangiales bacterium]